MLEPIYEVVGVAQVPLRMLSRSIVWNHMLKVQDTLSTAPSATNLYWTFATNLWLHQVDDDTSVRGKGQTWCVLNNTIDLVGIFDELSIIISTSIGIL